jgi:RHS repeat-associated protein
MIYSYDERLPQKFTGKERDDESGLDDFGARYYSSAMGRFMLPDPLLASATLENPQSWNRYSYALNNPLRFTDAEGLFPSPAFNCSETEKACLNDQQREILNNSTITDKDGNKLSGEALYNSLTEKQQNAFVNVTDRLASITLGDGTTALSQVSSISKFDVDRIFANVSDTLATSLQNSKDFTTASAGLHGDFNGISFKDTGVTFGNIQFSFNQARTVADIDIDIGNIKARNPFARILGGIVHTEEVVQNGVFGTKTNQDTVRRLLIHNPKIQTITPSKDPRFNRP